MKEVDGTDGHPEPVLRPSSPDQEEARRRRADDATLKELAKSYKVGAATISRLAA